MELSVGGPRSQDFVESQRAGAPRSHYAVVSECIQYLIDHGARSPSLTQLSQHVALSPSHLQRIFVEWAGVSPKEFLQNLSSARARRMLDDGRSLMSAAYDIGLSSSSRLHDLMVRVEGMTPAEYRDRARGLDIDWATFSTPFGSALFAATERGLCHLAFVDDEALALQELEHQWPLARLSERRDRLTAFADEVCRRMSGHGPQRRLGLVLKGSPLRLRVWRALLGVREGVCTSYRDIAQAIGSPNAARAVGQAVGGNSLAYLVPCHRVIRASGAIGEYRWGAARKMTILGRELSAGHSRPI